MGEDFVVSELYVNYAGRDGEKEGEGRGEALNTKPRGSFPSTEDIETVFPGLPNRHEAHYWLSTLP